MCKILVIPGLNPENKELNFQFMSQMADIMSAGNDDGLGYAALDKEGKMFGERWLFNTEAFDQRKNTHTVGRKIDRSKVNKIKMALGDFVELEEEKELPSFEKYGVFGTPTDEIAACILHARRATNTVNYNNTHPFVDTEKQIAVIHNGVITNHTKEDEVRSTCDSERILNMYLKHNIATNPMNMQNLIDDLRGWFACGIFAKDKNGRNVIDIFKTSAKLGCAFVKELDAMVFSTDLQDIRQACYLMDLTIVSKSKDGVKDDILLRVDAMTGKSLLTLKYKDSRWTGDTYANGRWQRRTYNENTSAISDDDIYKDMLESWEKDKEEERRKEMEEAQAQIQERQKNNIINYDFNKVETRLTESEKQAELELKRAGLTEAEVKENEIRKRIDEFKSNGWEEDVARQVAEQEVAELLLKRQIRARAEALGKSQQWTPESVNKYVLSVFKSKGLTDKAIEETKAIVSTYDPLNESVAARTGFFHNKEHNIWVKRKNGIN